MPDFVSEDQIEQKLLQQLQHVHDYDVLACGTAEPMDVAAGALDPAAALGEVSRMKSASVKVVGQLRKTPWQRFARLQRTAAQLARGRGQPKGVFRFSSNEACDAWTASLNRNGR